ncbi:MAG: putative rane protein [Lachnospiraceae bacterium]|jgi:stage III sporulation protein AH|nr:putative rane protein [Lachnospiraceae bacterium]
MKNIFKKNQIIIVALAIMIIIAGYLNYSDRNNNDKTNTADFENGDVLDYDTSDATADDNDLESDLISLLDGEEDVAANEGEQTTTGETTAGEVADEQEDAEAVATSDISDEDEQLAVSDTGEVLAQNDDSEAPGEAVLVSTSIPANYFATAKLAREQLRAKSRETLNAIIDNVNLSKEDKADAVDALINLTALAEKEFNTEISLEAKGFSDAVVTIGEKVNVIINATSINEQEIAQIQDIVTRNTEVDVSNIVISPVVKEE